MCAAITTELMKHGHHFSATLYFINFGADALEDALLQIP